ncbi:MAG: hypothetical protein BWY99_01833 [Synergistetes bacterium ADurb.BinA166]|nr:MAG: hypothetical protein BWY99_01833 [Synergistetes bacterium ADurb.BinA166]
MATKRYAKSILDRKNVALDEWMEEIRGQNEGAVPRDFVQRTAKTILRKCDPKQYLLSHATIVASVDCYSPRKVKTGRLSNQGVQIDVKWPDFRIKPECHPIINNNGDAWQRSLLLSSYRTFIGAHNYLEHIQLPELSKGFIVDAIARDLGTSCYIDILVATDRKHGQLVSDILTGAITGLSMGCISLFTTCTKCGNVSADDSQLCPCIQYEGKGSKFLDEDGVEHPLAELIGHVSVPNSNQFIEASWVRNPAFSGAVRRNILNPDSAQFASRMDKARVIQTVRAAMPEMDGLKKAASTRVAQGQDEAPQDAGQDLFGDQGGGDEGGGDEGDQNQQGQDSPDQGGGQDQGTPPDPSTPADKSDAALTGLLEKAQEQIMTILVDKLGEKLTPKPEDVGTVAPVDLGAPNDNLVRSSEEFDRRLKERFPRSPTLVRWASSVRRLIMERGAHGIRASGITARDLIVLSWIEDRCNGREHSASLYKVAMSVGPMKSYPSKNSYLAACRMRLGHDLSPADKSFLSRKGQISSLANF